MRRTLTLDMTAGYEHLEPLELTVRLRVPVSPPSEDDHTIRISIDHQLEEIRKRLRNGTAAKADEDNLVIFRLLQAFGFEFWPIEREDL